MADYVDWDIKRRKTGYVLIRADSDGSKQEMELSEQDVQLLARLFPNYARSIVASKTPPGSGVSASFAAHAREFRIAPDIHNDLVLLKLIDEHEADFDFSFTPSGAKDIAQRLIATAEKIENIENKPKQ